MRPRGCGGGVSATFGIFAYSRCNEYRYNASDGVSGARKNPKMDEKENSDDSNNHGSEAANDDLEH